MTCPHGEPFPGCGSDSHADALDTIVGFFEKYKKKGRDDVGYKSARKFADQCPDLVDTFTIAFLSSAATRTLLAKDGADQRRFALFLAQAISAFEKRLYGSASAADVERDTLIHFFKCRIPCSCLDGLAEEEPPEETGVCASTECGICKPVAELMACAACKSVFYCDSNCQVTHWPIHAQACCMLATKADETSVTDMETSGQFSVYSLTSARSGRTDRTGKSGKSGSRSSRKSASRRHHKRKEDEQGSLKHSPNKSPNKSPRKSPIRRSPRRTPKKSITDSPTKSVRSISSSKKKKKERMKSISLLDDNIAEKTDSKSKAEKLDSSESLSSERDRRKKNKHHSSTTSHEEHCAQRKSKSNRSSRQRRHHDKNASEKKKSKSKEMHKEIAQ